MRNSFRKNDNWIRRCAPGFDKDHWPETTEDDDSWLADVYRHYGYGPYWYAPMMA
ncbi:MAG: hypothetical protein WBO46_05030 [Caldilineaceae bacterium]